MTIARVSPPLVFGVLGVFAVLGPLAACGPSEKPNAPRASADGSGVDVYRGIPFAAPPVGPLRWRAPQPVEPASDWKAASSASKFRPICEQQGAPWPPGAPPEPMSEDCLYLNVWTPTYREEPLPVMVWIYGGGWTTGTGSAPLYAGDQLAKRGVVVVTFNYRVGAFGFLAHPDLARESPSGSAGNYGLLDQIAALRWVHDHIAELGGDPNRVTVFGQSAGSMSIALLTVSPLARGLFQRVIGESGGVFIPPAIAPNGDEFLLAGAIAEGERFGSAAGAPSIAALRALPAAEVLTAQRKFDFHFIADGTVIPELPYAAYTAGHQADVPMLLGYNAGDGLSFISGQTITAASFAADIEKSYGKLPPPLLAQYPATSDAEARASRGNLERDLRFGYDMWTWARLQTATGRGAVFAYLFDHVPPYPKGSASADWGAGHGMEMRYVFGHLEDGWAWSAADRGLADAMATYWTNFAKTGDPNGAGVVPWPAFGADGRALELADPIHAGELANLGALRIFDAVFAQARGN